jgi:hypothetical protein
MGELCYCGRLGAVEERQPASDEIGRWALRCPNCGQLDYLGRLSG